MQEMRHTVQSVWIPSHLGIHLSELADEVAQEVTEKMLIDFVSKVNMIKNEMQKKRNKKK